MVLCSGYFYQLNKKKNRNLLLQWTGIGVTGWGGASARLTVAEEQEPGSADVTIPHPHTAAKTARGQE